MSYQKTTIENNVVSYDSNINEEAISDLLSTGEMYPYEDETSEKKIEINFLLKHVSSSYKPYGHWTTEIDVEVNSYKLTLVNEHTNEESHTCFNLLINDAANSQEERDEAAKNYQSAVEHTIEKNISKIEALIFEIAMDKYN